MGFRTGPLIGPDDMRELHPPRPSPDGKLAHEAGKLYLLHSCGKLELIMEDLIEDVRIDARHSFEETAEPVDRR